MPLGRTCYPEFLLDLHLRSGIPKQRRETNPPLVHRLEETLSRFSHDGTARRVSDDFTFNPLSDPIHYFEKLPSRRSSPPGKLKRMYRISFLDRNT